MAFLGRSHLVRATVVAGACGALAAGMLVAAGPAGAQALACGSTLMASVTLTSNLNCSHDTAGNALTIGAAAVTVNLNGHTILGPGDLARTEGVVDDAYSGLTVENGTISDFPTGVDVEGSSGSDLTGVVVRHLITRDKSPLLESVAVFGQYLDGASIHKLSSYDAGLAVELNFSEDSTVSGSHMVACSIGVWEYGGTGDTFSGNTLSGTVAEGMFVYQSPGDLVESNTITGAVSGEGIDFESTDTTITQNVVNDLNVGIYDEGGTDQPDNTVSDNTGSRDGYGLYAYFPYDETYTGNTFGHGDYGMETDYPLGTTTLMDNTTNDNAETGIYVYTSGQTGYSETLTGNTANGNQFGLYSQIPTSGTGNQASGNKVVNCYNVSCPGAAPRAGRIAAPPHHAPGPAPTAMRGRRK